MATITRIKSGAWRAQIRRKGQYASSTFRAQADAERWARDIERRVDLGQTISAATGPHPTTLHNATSGSLNEKSPDGSSGPSGLTF